MNLRQYLEGVVETLNSYKPRFGDAVENVKVYVNPTSRELDKLPIRITPEDGLRAIATYNDLFIIYSPSEKDKNMMHFIHSDMEKILKEKGHIRDGENYVLLNRIGKFTFIPSESQETFDDMDFGVRFSKGRGDILEYEP